MAGWCGIDRERRYGAGVAQAATLCCVMWGGVFKVNGKRAAARVIADMHSRREGSMLVVLVRVLTSPPR